MKKKFKPKPKPRTYTPRPDYRNVERGARALADIIADSEKRDKEGHKDDREPGEEG